MRMKTQPFLQNSISFNHTNAGKFHSNVFRRRNMGLILFQSIKIEIEGIFKNLRYFEENACTGATLWLPTV